MKNYLKIILFLIVPQCLAFTQQITNLHQKIENGRIVITYDLKGNVGEIYTINVTAENEVEIFFPQVIAGDLNSISPGEDKTIWWEPILEGLALKGWQIILTANIMLFDMRNIPSGTYKMGCGSWTSTCAENEKPVHTVTISSFFMSETEVTQAQWKAIMGTNPSHFKGDNFPIDNISWNDIQKFLVLLNQQTGERYRLPTEAEWEYAARSGGKNEKYAGTSSSLGDYAWYAENNTGETHPVGQKKPNGLGLYDMSGNVWEWCSDGYDKDYFTISPPKDPTGAMDSGFRVLRGGSWINLDYNCRSSNRRRYDPQGSFNYSGFRIAMDNK